jgi:hypothetical protein
MSRVKIDYLLTGIANLIGKALRFLIKMILGRENFLIPQAYVYASGFVPVSSSSDSS